MLWKIDKYFMLTPSSIGDPDIYLGSKLDKMRLENRLWAWANILSSYVKLSVANVEKNSAELNDASWQLPKKKSENPFVGYYALEICDTLASEHDLASWYQYLIEMLIWMVEIGRVEMITEVLMMES